MVLSEQELATATKVLMVRDDLRTKEDIRRLVDITKQIHFFKPLAEDIHEACCRRMRLLQCASAHTLFNFGDPGDYFCIILSGQVSVRVPAEEATSPALRRSPTRYGKAPDMVEVAVLENGASFGELALLQDKSRAASVVTRSTCTFAVLEKSDFNQVLRVEEEKKMKAKISFFESLPAFADWPQSKLRALCYYIRQVWYRPLETIYKEGDEAKDVFFLADGEVTVPLTQILKQTAVNHSNSVPRVSLTSSFSLSKSTKTAKICIKHAKDMFGDEFPQERVRKVTCVCGRKPVRCFVISSFDYERRIVDEETKIFLGTRRQHEEKWLHSRLQSIERAQIYMAQPPPPAKAPTMPRAQLPKLHTRAQSFFLSQTVADELSSTVVTSRVHVTSPRLSLRKNLKKRLKWKPYTRPRNFFVSGKRAIREKYRLRGSDEGLSPKSERLMFTTEVDTSAVSQTARLRRSKHNLFRFQALD